MKYLLDTHIWIWWHTAPHKLSKRVLKTIANNSNYDELLLSAISPWEFAKLVEKERLVISCNPKSWLDEALEMPRLRLVALTPQIAYSSTVLPQPFQGDPADQIIVATAREEEAILITADRRILDYQHCNTLW
jgi:PIN domain nuclease of toxin-antitoxin system